MHTKPVVGWGDIDRLFWSEELPRVEDPSDANALERFIREHSLDVVFLDPAYLMMSGDAAENIFCQGAKLVHLNRIMGATGATIVLIHHLRKGGKADPFSPPELEDIAWSGFAEWARQWILVGRRERYEPGSGLHRLWMNSGGSMGHSALWALDVDEGAFEPGTERRWDVSLSRAEEARETARAEQAAGRERARLEKQRARLESDRRAIVEAMVGLGRPENKTTIREQAGVGKGDPFNRAWASLLRDGNIKEAGTVLKARNQVPAFEVNTTNG